MNTALKQRMPAFLCALVLLLCALATYPFAEIGMNDDWSYVQTARMFAQTGHFVYNGWAAMILGWQVPLGALFDRLFGPSFTSIRASTLLVALVTAFLLQRTFIRAGISSRNATVATLALVLSPLFLPLALSFMSDVNGLFCVIVCLYSCLRALQARNDRAVLAWLAFAALTNAVGGTVRQIIWLGVLVMFPSAIWLLRSRRHVLAVGAMLYVASLLIVFGSLHWFNQQPYSLPAPLISGLPDKGHINLLIGELISLFFSLAMLLLPVLIAFVPEISLRNRRTAMLAAFGGLLWIAVCALLVVRHPNTLDILVAPFRGNYLTVRGLADPFGIKGDSPIVLSFRIRLLITAVVDATLLCFFAWSFSHWRRLRPAPEHARSSPIPSETVSWHQLLILIGPFTFSYMVFLLPSALNAKLYDRYLLPLLPVAMIVVVRLYQESERPDLPLLSRGVVLLFALYTVAGTHDLFAEYRARRAATMELRAAGISDTAIDAGFEHNAMTQIELLGHLYDPGGALPNSDQPTQEPFAPSDCRTLWGSLTPAIIPSYTLSYDPNACGGLSHFAPVTYREWLLARTISVFVVNTAKTTATPR